MLSARLLPPRYPRPQCAATLRCQWRRKSTAPNPNSEHGEGDSTEAHLRAAAVGGRAESIGEAVTVPIRRLYTSDSPYQIGSTARSSLRPDTHPKTILHSVEGPDGKQVGPNKQGASQYQTTFAPDVSYRPRAQYVSEGIHVEEFVATVLGLTFKYKVKRWARKSNRDYSGTLDDRDRAIESAPAISFASGSIEVIVVHDDVSVNTIHSEGRNDAQIGISPASTAGKDVRGSVEIISNHLANFLMPDPNRFRFYLNRKLRSIKTHDGKTLSRDSSFKVATAFTDAIMAQLDAARSQSNGSWAVELPPEGMPAHSMTGPQKKTASKLARDDRSQTYGFEEVLQKGRSADKNASNQNPGRAVPEFSPLPLPDIIHGRNSARSDESAAMKVLAALPGLFEQFSTLIFEQVQRQLESHFKAQASTTKQEQSLGEHVRNEQGDARREAFTEQSSQTTWESLGKAADATKSETARQKKEFRSKVDVESEDVARMNFGSQSTSKIQKSRSESGRKPEGINIRSTSLDERLSSGSVSSHVALPNIDTQVDPSPDTLDSNMLFEVPDASLCSKMLVELGWLHEVPVDRHTENTSSDLQRLHDPYLLADYEAFAFSRMVPLSSRNPVVGHKGVRSRLRRGLWASLFNAEYDHYLALAQEWEEDYPGARGRQEGLRKAGETSWGPDPQDLPMPPRKCSERNSTSQRNTWGQMRSPSASGSLSPQYHSSKSGIWWKSISKGIVDASEPFSKSAESSSPESFGDSHANTAACQEEAAPGGDGSRRERWVERAAPLSSPEKAHPERWSSGQLFDALVAKNTSSGSNNTASVRAERVMQETDHRHSGRSTEVEGILEYCPAAVPMAKEGSQTKNGDSGMDFLNANRRSDNSEPLSLIDELFPPKASTNEGTRERPAARLGLTPLEVPKRHMSLMAPGRPPAQEQQVHQEFDNSDDGLNVLIFTNASKHLLEEDFRRLIPKGKHIEDWRNIGGYERVIPGRNPQTMERTNLYYLVFSSLNAARHYQANVNRMYDIAREHTPTSASIPPPLGFLVDGEDVNAIKGAFALCSPLGLRPQMNIKVKPHREEFARFLENGGYDQLVTVRHAHKVLLRIPGPPLAKRDLRQYVHLEGKLRSLAYSLVEADDAIARVEVCKRPVTESALDDSDDVSVISEGEQCQGKETVQSSGGELGNLWIVSFASDAEAKRFAREAHERPFPSKQLGIQQDLPSYERSGKVAAEVLW